METTAIILAGGMGTRLRSVVPDLPKPMAPISGRPFIEYLMDYWSSQGVTRFILSVGYKKDAIISHFGREYRSIPVSYAIEREPLGTGGGLLHAARGLDDPFLVLNGDTLFKVDLSELKKFHESHKSSWTFALFRSSETKRYMGMEINTNQEITALRVSGDGNDCLVNGGVYMVERASLADLMPIENQKCSLEDELLPLLKDRGERFYGLESPGVFLDIGVPEDYSRASGILVERE